MSDKSLHAVLQAGGVGSRLRPLSHSMPKALLPVGGKPMVEQLLYQIVDAGIRNITIIVGYQADQLVEHIEKIRGHLPSDVSISFYREPRPLGNFGALGSLDVKADRIVFAFGDLVTDLDFRELVAIHDGRGCDITLASHYEEHRLQLGEMSVDGIEVCDYVEKPLKKFLICSGIGVFERRTLNVVDVVGIPCGISDMIRGALAGGLRVTHWTHGAFWMDVNTEELLRQAESAVADRRRGTDEPRRDPSPARMPQTATT